MKKFHQKPNAFVEQVSINVQNLEKSITFYQDILGFSILSQEENKAILTADGNRPILTLEQPENVQAKEARTTGLYHFAILLPTRADLGSFLQHLLQKQYKLGASDHLVSEAIYIDDPDGNGIEIYRDRSASEWNWENDQVEMATIALDGEGVLASSTTPWNGLPKETIMGHVHLHVANLEATEKFYREGLGFDVVTRYPGALFMSTGGYHHHIGLNVWNGEGAKAPTENSVGLNWYTIVYDNASVREKVSQQLEQLGVTVTKLDAYYKTTDPSGNEIHLVI